MTENVLMSINAGYLIRAVRETKKINKENFRSKLGLESKEELLKLEDSKIITEKSKGEAARIATALNDILGHEVIDRFMLTSGEMTDEEAVELYKLTGIVAEDFSILAIDNCIEELEKDERYAPYGIKCLGYANEELKTDNKLKGSFVQGYIDSKVKYQYPLPMFFFQILASDKRISKKTFNYLLSPEKANNNNIWFYGLPYVIHEAYEVGNIELFEKAVSLAEENNKRVLKNERGDYSLYDNGLLYQGIYGCVRIYPKTLDLAIERHDIKNIERLNNINLNLGKYFIYHEASGKEYRALYMGQLDSYVLEKARTDCNPNLSEIEKHIKNCIHYGILNIEELIPETYVEQEIRSGYQTKIEKKKVKNDFVSKYANEIAAAINKYPITYAELVDDCIMKDNWDGIEAIKNDWLWISNQKAVNNSQRLRKFYELLDSDCVKNKNKEEARNLFDDFFRGGIVSDVEGHIPYDKERAQRAGKPRPYVSSGGNIISKNNLREEATENRKEIAHDLLLEYKMYNKIDDLNAEYFYGLLEKGNYRDLLIDLCVRLETILEEKYHLEGDLSNMIDEHYKGITKYSDYEERNIHVEDPMRNLLLKMNRCRNNAVHRNTTDESMTVDELKKCIDHICSL